MMSAPYAKWDEIVIKHETTFGYTTPTFEGVKVTIVGMLLNEASDTISYLCYVPKYLSLPLGFDRFRLSDRLARLYGADARFVNELACYVNDSTPILRHIRAPKGETCDHCKTWFEGVERKDGSYNCRACRENPYR